MLIQNTLRYIPLLFIITITSCTKKPVREIVDFNKGWKFTLNHDSLAQYPDYNDDSWRLLDLPHDWSIEGDFSNEHTTTQAGGGLPAGIGWYRKKFTIPSYAEDKMIFIDFDGVYRNSEVWINGHYLGKRPYGYISFRYDLTPYILKGNKENTIAVKADNSIQPNSRWYTGSGIYRNVKLVFSNNIMVNHWGSFITTPEITKEKALIVNQLKITNYRGQTAEVTVQTILYDTNDKEIAKSNQELISIYDTELLSQKVTVSNPQLWSVDEAVMYKAKSIVKENNRVIDEYTVPFGIRYFKFDPVKGFFLNGEYLKILGVCNHHDLGALGSAVNKSALKRQLRILKDMGCNAIRTAHNPPAPELLDLCDQMGFLVMNEAFDVWKKKKAKKDYHLVWDDWHKRDLEDFIKRDRNHPSIVMWSIGNEIREQFDSTGTEITEELVNCVKTLDNTRPVTCALTENKPEKNYIYQSKSLDVLSFNYKQNDYQYFPEWYPGESIIASENMSAFASRGTYNMPSDSIQRWPEAYKQPLKNPNPDFTISAYDHISAFWGSTHEETWRVVKKMDFISGLFIWSGFDFLGEPEPYEWPARSSYYGIIDLAGFPKDTYYMYQSEWSDKTMLHVFPHWNWNEGQLVDVWAYYNNADEAELFLNGRTHGVKHKSDSTFHVMWRLPFEKGEITVVTKKNGETVLKKTIQTAGKASKIVLIPEEAHNAQSEDNLIFVEVNVVDGNSVLVPFADNLVQFNISGPATIVGIDNGYQADLTSMKGNSKQVFRGKCIVMIKPNGKGKIQLRAESENLNSANLIVSH